MFANHSRKIGLAALLALILSAPASASESTTTNAQQIGVGQTATDVASAETSEIITEERFQTTTNGRIAEPRPLQRPAELRPSASGTRQPIVIASRYRSPEYTPLILGIGY